MTRETIRRLLADLPDESVWRIYGRPISFSSRDDDDPNIIRILIEMEMLDFGWAYCREMVRLHAGGRASFPDWLQGDDPMLVSAYQCLLDPSRELPGFQEALALQSMPVAQAVLEAFLLCRDLKIDQIASELRLPVDAVKFYVLLFFDVSDRQDDFSRAMIAFPDGRWDEILGNHMERLSFREILFRTAVTHGAGHVRYLSGMIGIESLAEFSETRASDLESSVFAHADIMIKSGLINHGKIPVIRQAIGLVAAHRRGEKQTSTGSDEHPFAPLASSIAEEIREFGKAHYQEVEMARLRFNESGASLHEEAVSPVQAEG